MLRIYLITTFILMSTSQVFAAAGHDALNAGGTHSYHSSGAVFGGNNNSGNNDNYNNDDDDDDYTQVAGKIPEVDFHGVFRISPTEVGVVTPFGNNTFTGRNHKITLPGQKPYKVPGGGGTNGYKLRFEPDNDNFKPLMMKKVKTRVGFAKGKKKTKRQKAQERGIKLAIKHYTKGMSKKKKKKFKRKVTFVFYEFAPNK